MVVDDDDSVRELLARMTRGCLPEAVVTAAGGGAEALDMFRQRPYDLVISDYRMPAISGVALLRAIRATGSQVPFILCSAEVTCQTEALQAGVTAFMPKPLVLEHMLQVIRRCL
jgi:CheY-like chemotaxis protein